MSKIGKISIPIPEKVKVILAKITLTFSGIGMLILPIFDIKIPYKLFRRQHVVFWHLYQS